MHVHAVPFSGHHSQEKFQWTVVLQQIYLGLQLVNFLQLETTQQPMPHPWSLCRNEIAQKWTNSCTYLTVQSWATLIKGCLASWSHLKWFSAQHSLTATSLSGRSIQSLLLQPPYNVHLATMVTASNTNPTGQNNLSTMASWSTTDKHSAPSFIVKGHQTRSIPSIFGPCFCSVSVSSIYFLLCYIILFIC